MNGGIENTFDPVGSELAVLQNDIEVAQGFLEGSHEAIVALETKYAEAKNSGSKEILEAVEQAIDEWKTDYAKILEMMREMREREKELLLLVDKMGDIDNKKYPRGLA